MDRKEKKETEKSGKRSQTDFTALYSSCLFCARCVYYAAPFVGQQKVQCSLASVIHLGRVSVSQMINCALALKAVNFRAINSDEPHCNKLLIPVKKMKVKDTHLCSASRRILFLPFV